MKIFDIIELALLYVFDNGFWRRKHKLRWSEPYFGCGYDGDQ